MEAAAASGDNSTSGHFFWLHREQQEPESEARPCTVWRWWRCGQMCGMLGEAGGSLQESKGVQSLGQLGPRAEMSQGVRRRTRPRWGARREADGLRPCPLT